MQQWWGLHKKALPIRFTKDQKQTLQELTGQIPILLSALTGIRMDGCGEFPIFLEKLWKSPEVKKTKNRFLTLSSISRPSSMARLSAVSIVDVLDGNGPRGLAS